MGEVVEAIVNNQWYDCKILSVVPPTDEEIAQDAEVSGHPYPMSRRIFKLEPFFRRKKTQREKTKTVLPSLKRQRNHSLPRIICSNISWKKWNPTRAK